MGWDGNGIDRLGRCLYEHVDRNGSIRLVRPQEKCQGQAGGDCRYKHRYPADSTPLCDYSVEFFGIINLEDIEVRIH